MTKKRIRKSRRIKEAIVDILLNLPLFDQLDGEELDIVATYMNYFELDKGTYLFKEGDRGDYVCFVVEGTMQVFKESAKGKRVLIATLPKGSTLGEMSIIDETNRSATVRASENVVLLILSRKGFDIILDKHPKIGIKILKGIARLLSLNMRRTSSLLADYMPSL